MPHVYVTGHKNPDTDTIASAIGYAEYKNLVDPENRYEATRLGEVNAQTRWALEKSGAGEPTIAQAYNAAGQGRDGQRRGRRPQERPFAQRGTDDGPAEHKPAPHSRGRRHADRDHNGAEPGAHVRARVARGLHLRRQSGLGRGDGRGTGGRAPGRRRRQRVLRPAVGHLHERGLHGQVHELRRRRGHRGPRRRARGGP